MPGYDRKIDPLTGDYVDAPGGAYAETFTIEPSVYHQMKTERNRWWGDPDAGSDLYLVKQQGTGVAGQRFAENALRAALQPFVDQGLAADIETEVEVTARGRVIAAASLTDIQQGPIEVIAPIGEG